MKPQNTQLTDEQRQHLREWVAALRSGEYQQDNQKLKTANGFCCLGVACDILPKDLGLGEWVEKSWKYTTSKGETTYENSVLPQPVADYYGVDSDPIISDPIMSAYNSVLRATTANDIQGWSFFQIADAVEEYYEL